VCRDHGHIGRAAGFEQSLHGRFDCATRRNHVVNDDRRAALDLANDAAERDF
jgi:hypothetical protein